jgi:enoyl-CoA hydratase/carnithine racemase
MVVASPKATFGLPEATVGLYPSAGGLPRIVRNCGIQIASEIAMTGQRLTPHEVWSVQGLLVLYLFPRVANHPT